MITKILWPKEEDVVNELIYPLRENVHSERRNSHFGRVVEENITSLVDHLSFDKMKKNKSVNKQEFVEVRFIKTFVSS